MRLAAAVLLALLASCARMEAPSGGPEDETPPVLLAASPAPSAGVPELSAIELQWSERLSEATAEVTVYPPLPARVSVSGSRIGIELEEPLGARTMVVHLPPTVADLRGVEAGASTDLPYTGLPALPTGGALVTLGRQSGTVLGERVMIDILSGGGDLLRRTSPDTTGTAFVGWLEPGDYLVRCYEDPDMSFTWEHEVEAGAETAVAVALDTLALELVLAVVDTVGPRISSVTATDRHHLVVTFNEQPEVPLEAGAVFLLRDSTGAGVPVLGAWLSGARDRRSLTLATGSAGKGRATLFCSGLSDLPGNVSSPDSIEYETVDTLATDTLTVGSTYPPPGMTDAPPKGPVTFSVSDWVDPAALREGFSVVRVSDGTPVDGSLEMTSGRAWSFTPHHEFLGQEQYRVTIRGGAVDPEGDSLQAFSWSFTSAWGDEPGSISGRTAGGGRVILEIRAAGSSGTSMIHDLGSGGEYSIDGIPAGRYTVSAASDRNGSGSWDPGEPYGAYPGVVLVRPGMETTEVDIEILP
jgi:hypothetical protein